ncbi:fibroblast growth factor receptor-like 1 [Haliotis asinina]|uniref:fibroblast growth factor receptor-like 1 n=1 Tax=Haliotis asinina TaxID=109174 RepID=UPI0035326474
MAIACLVLALVVSTTDLSSANGPPKISGNTYQRHIAKLGKNTRLECPVEADPLPLTQWKKDGKNIPPGETRFKVTPDGQLRIKEVQMNDAGNYLCKATNGFGHININYTLIVVDEEKGIVKENDNEYLQSPDEDLRKAGAAPTFIDENKMKHKVLLRPVGSSARLKCRARGNPRPHVQWFKDGTQPIEDNEHSHPMWILKLHDMKEVDTGKYTCVVTNRLGSINYTYSIEVIEKMMKKNKPVLIPPHPKNTSVVYGGTASFQCRVRSVVDPHIQWLKRIEDSEDMDNHNSTISVKGQQFVVLKTGDLLTRPDGTYLNKLVIHRATAADAGMYICLGANSMGYNFRSAFLSVVPGEGSSYAAQPDTTSSSTNNLPLIIGVPSCVVLVIVIVAIFLLQRRRRCNTTSGGLKVQRMPVPTHDKDMYTNPYNANMLQASRDKLPKSTPSIDFYSDISSVSRSQHNHSHQHVQYSY